jgi:hypothetical protein
MRVLGVGLAAAAVALVLMVGPVTGFGAATSISGSFGSSSPCHARITSVTGLTHRNLYHRIVIKGTCFGTHPTYVNVSTFAPYNGTDTQNCGTGKAPPTLSISEWGSKLSSGDWSAGRFVLTDGACPWGDSIGLTLLSWTSTMIVIGHGFGNALGTSTQNSGAPWQMTPHTPCAVHIFNPANETTPANFTLPLGTC